MPITIENALGRSWIVALQGPRQSGKTTIGMGAEIDAFVRKFAAADEAERWRMFSVLP